MFKNSNEPEQTTPAVKREADELSDEKNSAEKMDITTHGESMMVKTEQDCADAVSALKVEHCDTSEAMEHDGQQHSHAFIKHDVMDSCCCSTSAHYFS